MRRQGKVLFEALCKMQLFHILEKADTEDNSTTILHWWTAIHNTQRFPGPVIFTCYPSQQDRAVSPVTSLTQKQCDIVVVVDLECVSSQKADAFTNNQPF